MNSTKFGAWLKGRDFDGELLADHLEETKYSFVWNANAWLTEKGEKRFAKILNSTFTIDKYSNIRLKDDTITQANYDLFLAAAAGWVSAKVYEEHFIDDITKIEAAA